MNLVGVVGTYLLHGISILLICHSRYGRKRTEGICAVMAAVQVGIALGARYFLTGAAWVYLVFLITFAMVLAEIFWISAEGFPKTLFLYMIYVQAFMVVTYLSGITAKWLLGGSQDGTAYLRVTLHGTLLAVYGLVFRKRFEAIRREIADKDWWPMCILSVLHTGYMSYITMRAQSSYFRQVDVPVFLLALAAVLAGYGVIFRTIHYMRESVLNQEIEQRQKILVEKLELMKDAEEEARRMRHDLRHHLRNVMEYARDGDTEALLGYLGEYDREVGRTQPLHFCANPTLDHILTVYARKAQMEGIQTDFHAPVGADVGIGEVDLVNVLANLMENALHGCLESGKEERRIRVRIRWVSGRLSVLVGNSCREDIPFAGGLPEEKGVGISSILRSAEKNGGDADFSCREGWFTARVVMRQK